MKAKVAAVNATMAYSERMRRATSLMVKVSSEIAQTREIKHEERVLSIENRAALVSGWRDITLCEYDVAASLDKVRPQYP